MRVKRLHATAKLPTKAHAGDLGYDLYANHQYISQLPTIHIWPGNTELVSTGIAIQFPEGYGGLIRDRSSIATKLNLIVVAGVIDNGYTGEIKVALHNAGNNAIPINAGDKIAQLILIPTVDFPVEEVANVVSVDGRGANGFGSTGMM